MGTDDSFTPDPSKSESLVLALREALLTEDGDTEPALRAAIEARAASLGDPDGDDAVPPELRPYVDKVARHAYKVTDEDIEALRQAGYHDGQIFEITAAAALGAGRVRRRLALDLLARSSR